MGLVLDISGCWNLFIILSPKISFCNFYLLRLILFTRMTL